MDIKNNFQELCERFFHLEMDEEEVNEFMKQLEANPDLKSQFDAEAKIHAILDQPSIIENDPDLEESKEALEFLKKSLKEESKNAMPSIPPYKESISIHWGPLVAAAACILIISVILLNNFTSTAINGDIVAKEDPIKIDSLQPISSDSLFKEFYTTYAFNESTPIELENAFLKFNKGDFSGSLKELDAFSGSRSGTIEPELEYQRQFGRGLCQLELENFQEAIKALEKATGSSSSNLKAAANWYLALAYVKVNNTKEAMKRLSMIPDSSFHKAKAKELQNRIGKQGLQ